VTPLTYFAGWAVFGAVFLFALYWVIKWAVIAARCG
jgi:hypothetical protein